MTFDLGTNLDIAQVQVQNRVAIAQPRLPADVRNIGVTVAKASPDLMMVVHLLSPDKSRDALFISNYASLEIKDALDARRRRRLDHRVRQPRLFDAGLARSRPAAIARHDRQRRHRRRCRRRTSRSPRACSTSRRSTKPGAFQIAVQTLGRLADPERVRQYRRQADAERGGAAQGCRPASSSPRLDYSSNSYLDLDPAVALAIFQRPGSNALATATGHPQDHGRSCPSGFPHGLKYAIVYDPTQFIQQSVDAVIETILEAILLVVLVVVLFLQTWRAAIIPLVAIPVSLIGTFFFMAMFGFSLNNLSLFGLVLAVGIVVDDAIVVVENVERNIANGL